VPTWNFLHSASKLAAGDDDFWWPVTDLNAIEFDFVNPITNSVMFHAGPEKTYWMNKWMDTKSYRRYGPSQGKRWSWLPSWFPKNSNTPYLADDYILRYKINGKTFLDW